VGFCHGIFIEPPPSTIFFQISKLIFDILLCAWCVYTHTQALTSVKGPGNTFDLSPKWGIKTTAGCQLSAIYCFEKGRGPIDILWKISNGKVLAHLGFKSEVSQGSLTDLSKSFVVDNFSWDFYRAAPSTIFFQISKLIFDTLLWSWGAEPLDISWTIPNDKVLAHFGIRSKVLPRGLTDIGAWVGGPLPFSKQ
jgi:hypothetical protein